MTLRGYPRGGPLESTTERKAETTFLWGRNGGRSVAAWRGGIDHTRRRNSPGATSGDTGHLGGGVGGQGS